MKMTHKITVTMLSHAEAVEGIAHKAHKLLKNSGLVNEVVVEEIAKPKPAAKSIHSMVEVEAERQLPTLYIMTSGASLFFSTAPFNGRLADMSRITVSAMHPHYSNPMECADAVEKVFNSVGVQVIRSHYIEPKDTL